MMEYQDCRGSRPSISDAPSSSLRVEAQQKRCSICVAEGRVPSEPVADLKRCGSSRSVGGGVVRGALRFFGKNRSVITSTLSAAPTPVVVAMPPNTSPRRVSRVRFHFFEVESFEPGSFQDLSGFIAKDEAWRLFIARIEFHISARKSEWTHHAAGL